MKNEYIGTIELRCNDQEELYQILKQSGGGVILDLGAHTSGKRPYIRVYGDEIYQITAIEENGESEEVRLETKTLTKEQFIDKTQDTDLFFRLYPRSETPFAKEIQQKLRDQKQ